MSNKEQLELTVKDNAIHCGGCEARIETVLKKLPGVHQVKADHKTQLVRLTLDQEQTSFSDVRAKLEDLGYRADR